MYKLLIALDAVSRSNIDESDMYDVDIKPDTLTDEKFACCELISADEMKEGKPVEFIAYVCVHGFKY